MLGTLAFCLLLVLLPGCLVDPVCYDDGDCQGSEICDARQARCAPAGAECSDSGDCSAGFHCEAGRCVADSAESLVCPEGMVCVGDAYCIDQYEASRPDATADAMGEDTTRAVSRPGVIPWYQNPVSRATLDRFAAACRRAGKRLCSRDEWYGACAGSSETIYVFGDDFDRETCNSVDTFCDDHCRQNGIANCVLSPDCGYRYGSFHISPTGRFPDCVDEYGAFDINGNVWELVPSDRDYRGYEVRGGAFNCANASERLKCTYNAGWNELYAGFRCCWRPEGDAVP